MMVKKGLGKGLGALLDSAETVNNEIREMKLNEIEPNADQPRKNFNDEKLIQLAESIKNHGIIQPLIVKKYEDTYKIVAGERRWRAARIAGLDTVPVIIKDFSSKQVMEVALIENIQREDLNPIEEAEAYQNLAKEFKMSHETIAARVGKSRVAVTNTMRLLDASAAVKQALVDGRCSHPVRVPRSVGRIT